MLIKVTQSEATDEVEEYLSQQTKSWGYLPNYAAAFVGRPDVARAWAALNGAVRAGMDHRRYELATIGAARALRSTYCTAAHSKFLRDDYGDEASMVAIATGTADDVLSVEDNAVVAFAERVARDAASITEAEVEEMRRLGFTDDELGAIVFAAAARSFFTTVLDGFGVQADHRLGEQFDPEVREALVVGRPIADVPGVTDDPYYGAALAKIHHEGFGFHADACAPGILAHLAPVHARDGLVVEVGCGSGLLTKHLTDAGHRVIATDASPAMLDIAREYAPHALDHRLVACPTTRCPRRTPSSRPVMPSAISTRRIAWRPRWSPAPVRCDPGACSPSTWRTSRPVTRRCSAPRTTGSPTTGRSSSSG